jgi:hypothetical protein
MMGRFPRLEEIRLVRGILTGRIRIDSDRRASHETKKGWDCKRTKIKEEKVKKGWLRLGKMIEIEQLQVQVKSGKSLAWEIRQNSQAHDETRE